MRCIRISLLPRLFSRNSPTALVAFIVMQGLLKATLAIGLYLLLAASSFYTHTHTHIFNLQRTGHGVRAREKKIPVLFLFFMYALFLVYTHTHLLVASRHQSQRVCEREASSLFFLGLFAA